MKKLITFLFSLVFCCTAFAGQIKQIIFIGDSLSDNGNLYNVLKNVPLIPTMPKSPPYYNGRFSNGPTWAENVGKYYYQKSYIDYQIYAVGGATAIQHKPWIDKFAPPITLTGQVYDYLFHSLFVDKSQILYGIWIGANDYLYNTKTSDMDETSTNVVDSIAWSIDMLASRGAKNFLVLNLPDLSRIPYAVQENLTSELHAVTIMHNRKLDAAVKSIKSKHPDLNIVYVNIFDIFNEILDNTEKYNQLYGKNITNITQACWEGSMMLHASHATQEKMILADLQKTRSLSNKPSDKNVDTQSLAKFIVNSPSINEAYFTAKMAEAGLQPCSNAKQYLFWDHIHPSTEVHDVLASIVETKLTSFDI